jgi:MFS family permease
MLFTGWGVAFFSQASGTEAAVYYTPEIMKSSGVLGDENILLATMGVGLCKCVALFVASLAFDRIGRRPLLLLSAGGQAVALLTQGLAALFTLPLLSVAGLCMFQASFSLGFSPLTYVFCSEVFPMRVRAKGMAVTLLITRLGAGAISTSFITLEKALTIQNVWFIFAGVAVCALVFVWACVPETNGVALEEMRPLFEPTSNCRGAGLRENLCSSCCFSKSTSYGLCPESSAYDQHTDEPEFNFKSDDR